MTETFEIDSAEAKEAAKQLNLGGKSEREMEVSMGKSSDLVDIET